MGTEEKKQQNTYEKEQKFKESVFPNKIIGCSTEIKPIKNIVIGKGKSCQNKIIITFIAANL